MTTETTLERAKAAAGDDPNVAIAAWDASRARSNKTADAREAGQFGVGPSDLSACQKAVEFRERPPEGHEPVPTDKAAAIMGTLIHEGATEARRDLYPWRRFKVPVTVPGLDRDGEADEVDPVIGRVTDYKTAGQYKWDRVGQYGPPDGEWKQVLGYAFGLIAAGHDITEVELLYVNRETGRWESHKRQYVHEDALAAVSKLHALMDALEAGDPLPRQRGDDILLGPTVNTLCARFCPHVKTCWNLDEVPEGRTPEGWAQVRDDTDGAITATLATYDEARAIAKAAKERQDYAKTLLAGLEPGAYGDYTLRWTGGGAPKEVDDVDARVTQLTDVMIEAFEAQVPPPNPVVLPWPTKKKPARTAIEVKGVRVADRKDTP